MSNTRSVSIAFILGREQEIALAELKAVLNRFCFSFDIYRISGNVVFANIEEFSDDDALRLIGALGGTIKIYRILGPLQNDISNQLSTLILLEKNSAQSKFNFGISNYNPRLSKQQVNSFAIEAKKSLKGKLSLRFVESRDSAEISSILTLKNNLIGRGIEFAIFEDSIGVLIGLSNPEEWGRRDYEKPASDKFSGMLPPKLARTMINIALAQLASSSSHLAAREKDPSYKLPATSYYDNCVVIDPFCGSGSVLLEALMLGHDVIGSDISEKAVLDSKKNVDWLATSYKLLTTEHEVFQADATGSDFIENCKLKIVNYDGIAIVTEPYLGEPKKFKPSYNAAKGEYSKIKDMYLKFLENLKQLTISNKQLAICLVYPLVETTDKGRFSLLKDSVDEIKKLGYTQLRNSFVYGRDYQVVKREIVLLRADS